MLRNWKTAAKWLDLWILISGRLLSYFICNIDLHWQWERILKKHTQKQSLPKQLGPVVDIKSLCKGRRKTLCAKMRNRFNFHPIFCWTCRKSCPHHNEKKCDNGKLGKLLLAFSLRLLRVDHTKFYMLSISPALLFGMLHFVSDFIFNLMIFSRFWPPASNVNVL